MARPHLVFNHICSTDLIPKNTVYVSYFEAADNSDKECESRV